MAMTAKQRAALERRLPVHRVEESVDQPVEVMLSRRELCFLLEAIARFRDTQCAPAGFNPDCEMAYWYEGAQGQLERRCEHHCEVLLDRLIAQLPERP